MIRRKLPFLLQLLMPVLSLETIVQRKTPKGAPQRGKKRRFLSPNSSRDVREFQKRLQSADVVLTQFLLRILDGLMEFTLGSDDPKKVEEERIHLETMDKGEYRQGTGWIWNDHVVPEPESRSPFFERRERIIRNGIWNPTRKGWEYQGEFFGVWEH